MSGVEVVLGLVLGGIPLCISAMEHYADFKKVTGTFIDIRRQHGKDLRRVKLCELQFRLHLKQLLLPLLNDGIVDKPEYAELLLAPGGDGWKEKHVGEALEKRLDEGHQYYVETLKGMVATVAQLCKETYYAVYPAAEKTPLVAGATSGPDAGTTLADTLKPNFRPRLTRVQRYGIALTLASSHLQLHSTPWLHEQWTAENVHFPLTDDNGALTLHGEPYVLTQFEAANNKPPTGQSDQSFSTLGIVLLELCFGTRFEDHHLWQNPAYAPLRSDPNMRQVIACQWLKDVEGEAGDDYASAVNWTLRQAPLVVQGNKWREEFALNVVQPLQRYYEYLHPAP
ncbi:hypothetical protein LTR48_003192 [Friedmanniomyces endolithicus]|uniref:DUF7580 domain-containing protein n=1 Tax=Rachicladosporium monterosium TaxID=1507873 RepID=A0ABR0L9B9_9PEZI|nr:hypothetical protein LTR48_003192 [Friedmanniomyces endolithicus]KAK5145437.1 hypothetical protein LTR32_002812 [Rachicladosporium monterosium]